MPRTILVVGAGGFIGRHLVQRLDADGDNVLATGSGTDELVSPRVEPHARQLREPGDFAPFVEQSDMVAYLASASTPASSAGDPLKELQQNLRPLAGLLEALQEKPRTPLLYLSSGGSLYTRGYDAPADEGTPVSPRSYHGAAKAACEHFIEAWCAQFGGSACILRPSNVYGPGQHARVGFAVIPTAFDCIRRDVPMHVWGDGSSVRDYLYVDDLVDLCKRVLDDFPADGPHVFNASSERGVPLVELLELIGEVAGRPLTLHFEPGRAVDARHVVIDAASSRRTFGWTPGTDLHEGLERTWAWLNTFPQ